MQKANLVVVLVVTERAAAPAVDELDDEADGDRDAGAEHVKVLDAVGVVDLDEDADVDVEGADRERRYRAQDRDCPETHHKPPESAREPTGNAAALSRLSSAKLQKSLS